MLTSLMLFFGKFEFKFLFFINSSDRHDHMFRFGGDRGSEFSSSNLDLFKLFNCSLAILSNLAHTPSGLLNFKESAVELLLRDSIDSVQGSSKVVEGGRGGGVGVISQVGGFSSGIGQVDLQDILSCGQVVCRGRKGLAGQIIGNDAVDFFGSGGLDIGGGDVIEAIGAASVAGGGSVEVAVHTVVADFLEIGLGEAGP